MEQEKKGKKKRTIEYVPIRLKKQLENNREPLENNLQEQRKLINTKGRYTKMQQ